jgi:hypothetical protein
MRVLLVILLLVCLLAGAIFVAATAITPSGDDVLDAITAVSAPADLAVAA